MHSRKYRVASFLLAFVTCISLPALPNSAPLHVHGEEPGTAAAEAIEPASPLNNVIIAADDTVRFESKDYCDESDPVHVDSYFHVPRETLDLPTPELLDWFLQTPFVLMMSVVETLSSCRSPEFIESYKRYYHFHDAFNELIRRSDLPNAIVMGARQIITSRVEMQDTHLFQAGLEVLQEFLDHATIDSIMADSLPSDVYSYLTQTNSDAARVASEASGEVRYDPVGGIYSINGNNVSANVATRELTTDEKDRTKQTVSALVTNGVIDEVDLLYEPSSRYNCHSYAWYMTSASNPYWIENEDYYEDTLIPFLDDRACIYVNDQASLEPGEVQKGDIIVYRGTYYNELENRYIDCHLHSGVVHSVENAGEENEKIWIKSKWGAWGVYLHEWDNVLPQYKRNYQVLDVIYYRYHDYSYVYLSSNYHKGRIHTYVYTHQCSICNDIFYTTESLPCNGPPCIIPGITSLDDEDDVVN